MIIFHTSLRVARFKNCVLLTVYVKRKLPLKINESNVFKRNVRLILQNVVKYRYCILIKNFQNSTEKARTIYIVVY